MLTLVPCSVGIFVRCLSHCTPPQEFITFPVQRPRSSSAERPSRGSHREQGDQNGDISQKSMTQMDVPADRATTCSRQWRHDARVLGPFPSYTRVVGPPPFCVLMPPTLFLEYPFLWQLGRFLFGFASPGVLSQPPASLGRFLGRRPLSTVHHCPVAGCH